MSDQVNWEEQPGGLLLSVQRFDRTNPLHQETIIPAMQGTFAAISKKHGADLAEEGMRSNLIALFTDRTTADIYYAKWHDAAQEICMGVAYGWKTYGITPGGVLVDAEYTEDITLLRGATRQLIRSKTTDKIFPDEGLAKCLERIHLDQMRDRGVVYRFGEVDGENTTMRRQLVANGAEVFTGADSAILEFKRLPNTLLDTLPMGAKAFPIFKNGVLDDNNFLVSCAHGNTVHRSIVRLGQGTASGNPRADIRMYRQGREAESSVTRCFINSSLFVAKIEAEDRGFGNKYFDKVPDHLRPLLAARPDMEKIINPSWGKLHQRGAESTFYAALPEVHISVDSDDHLVKELKLTGACVRLHGIEPMAPTTNILRRQQVLLPN